MSRKGGLIVKACERVTHLSLELGCVKLGLLIRHRDGEPNFGGLEGLTGSSAGKL
jgi:hypothetical protein